VDEKHELITRRLPVLGYCSASNVSSLQRQQLGVWILIARGIALIRWPSKCRQCSVFALWM
jgi:hypothetical protein